MPITFSCKCGKKYQARDELLGKQFTCKACGAQLTVATASESVVQPSAVPSEPSTTDSESKVPESPPSFAPPPSRSSSDAILWVLLGVIVTPIAICLLACGGCWMLLLSPAEVTVNSNEFRNELRNDLLKKSPEEQRLDEVMPAEPLPTATDVKRLMSPAQLALGDPYVNSIGMVLVPIPAGKFAMGSTQDEIEALAKQSTHPKTEELYRAEGPLHEVTITQPFYIGACEVTQEQYGKIVSDQENLYVGPSRPADSVSWVLAIHFCNLLSESEGLPPYYEKETIARRRRYSILGGEGYRLPTEAEWEFACRAGTQTRWSFGDRAEAIDQYAWAYKNADGKTHNVGRLRPNPFGLFDMHGSVREWCFDYYGPYSAEPAIDPIGPAAGYRVIRGGSLSDPLDLRSAKRGFASSTDTPSRVATLAGFRVHLNGIRVVRTYTDDLNLRPKPPGND